MATEKSKILRGCVSTLGSIRVPVALTEEITAPVRAVMNVLEEMARGMEREAQAESQAEHEEART